MGVKKSLGNTAAERISIFLGLFQYTRSGREPELIKVEGEVLGV